MSTSTTLKSFASLQNDPSATTDLNFNFNAINTSLTNTLALNGQSPNQMQSTLDMNSNRIINLPTPVSLSEPATISYVNTVLSGGGTSGLTGVPVSAAMQPVVNASTIPIALNLLDQAINVKAYGAIGNNIADDTAAFQSAIAAAQALPTGGLIFIPPGTYKITSTLNITGTVSFVGSGTNSSILSPGVGTNCLSFSIPANAGIFCRDFGITYPSAANSQITAISLTCSASNNTLGCLFDNLSISLADTCIAVDKSQIFVIRACQFINYGANGGSGLFLQNTFNVDNGDFTVTENQFFSSTGISILLRGIGGARITNNKMGAPAGGIVYQLPNAANSSLILISGNGIESIGGASSNANGISFQRLGTTGTFVNVNIVGNEFGANSTGTTRSIYVPTDANGLWMGNVNIANNIDTSAVGTGSHTFLDIDSLHYFSVTGNSGSLSGTTPTSQFMVITRSAADTGVVGPNIHVIGIGASSITSTNTTTISPT